MKQQPWDHRHHPNLWLEAALFCLLGVLWRIPCQSQILHEWDSVQFALALDNFDIRLHQPHPPGMFVFYILLGRLCHLFIQNANASLVCLSTIATGLAAATVLILTSNWLGRKTGRIITLLLLTSPLVWFQGELALSYLLELFWVLLIVGNCFYLRYGNQSALFTATILMGLSGGIRPNTPFFLLPLWLVAVWLAYREKKYQLQHLVIAITLGIVSIACWFIPLVLMSGGWSEYWPAMQPWLNEHPQDGAGRSFQGIYLNLKMLVEALLYGIGFALIPTIWILRRQGKKLINQLWHDWRGQTLLLWIFPGLLYLTFVHMQRLGHCFTILPGVIVIAGWATYQATQNLQPFKPKTYWLLPVMVLVGNSLFFLLAPGTLDNLPTWQTIRDYDSHISERVTLIRKQFLPSETMVITRGRNARIREFYLPEYTGSSRTYEPGEETEVLDPNLGYLVLFEDKVMSNLSSDSGYHQLALPTTGTIRYFHWNPNQQVILNKSSVEIK